MFALDIFAGSRSGLIFRYIVLSIKINAFFSFHFMFCSFLALCYSIMWQRRQRQPDFSALLLHRLQVLLLMLTKNIITFLWRWMNEVEKTRKKTIFFLLKILTNIHCMTAERLWTLYPANLVYSMCNLHSGFFDKKKKKNKIQRFNENRGMKMKKIW